MDDYKTDEESAADIVAAVGALNAAIIRAARRGIHVDVSAHEALWVGGQCTATFAEVRIERRILLHPKP